MSARDPDAPPEPGVNIPNFGPDSAAMMDPAAIQAALAAQGDGRDAAPGPGLGGMNFQQFMSLDDGTKRQIMKGFGPPMAGDIIDSNDPMNSGHNLATKLWLTAGDAARERFGDADNPGFAKAMLGPDPAERTIRTNINPVGDDTAQSVMSSGNPPAAGWRKVTNPNASRNFPLVWRYDDWPDLFTKQAPSLPLAPAPPPRAPAQPMPSTFGRGSAPNRGGSFGAFAPPSPAPTPPPTPATSGQNYVNQFNNWLKTGVWA